jgi:hypothetical protein
VHIPCIAEHCSPQWTQVTFMLNNAWLRPMLQSVCRHIHALRAPTVLWAGMGDSAPQTPLTQAGKQHTTFGYLVPAFSLQTTCELACTAERVPVARTTGPGTRPKPHTSTTSRHLPDTHYEPNKRPFLYALSEQLHQDVGRLTGSLRPLRAEAMMYYQHRTVRYRWLRRLSPSTLLCDSALLSQSHTLRLRRGVGV